jgi:hypothetical protein
LQPHLASVLLLWGSEASTGTSKPNVVEKKVSQSGFSERPGGNLGKPDACESSERSNNLGARRPGLNRTRAARLTELESSVLRGKIRGQYFCVRQKSNNFFAKKGKFWSRKRAKKIKEKQGNQNFTKESEKKVIRKLVYRKDSYSKTWVQRKMLVFPKKCDFGFRSDSYKLFINLTLLGHVTENFNFQVAG